MTRTVRLLVAVAFVTLLLSLLGCSGAGQSAAQVRGQALQDIAADHLTAVLLAQRWLTILYDQPVEGTSHVVRPSQHPPIAWEYEGTNTDGSAFRYTWYEDWSGEGRIEWPDGRWKTIEWSVARELPGGHWAQDIVEQWSDGTRLEYTWQDLFTDLGDSHQTWSGTGRLLGGETLTFQIDRNTSRDILTMSSPGGPTLQFEVPLHQILGRMFAPDYRRKITGTGSGAAGVQTFAIGGDGADAWTSWRFTAPDGTSGDFGLAEGKGSGSIERGGGLLGTLRWDEEVTGTLYQTDAAAASVLPAELARRFAVDRYIAGIATMFPAPEW